MGEWRRRRGLERMEEIERYLRCCVSFVKPASGSVIRRAQARRQKQVKIGCLMSWNIRGFIMTGVYLLE